MAVNPVGFVQALDFGIPHFVTAKANDVVSGGQFLYAVSGTASSISSGLNSLVFADLQVNQPASGTLWPVGVAVHNAGSATAVSVCTKGFILAGADGTCTPGNFVDAKNGAHCVSDLGSNATLSTANAARVVGRAWTSAGSAGYCLVNLNL